MNAITRMALFTELEKIAADSEKKPHWAGDVAKGILGAGLGAGVGTGAAMLLEHSLPKVFQQRHPNVAPIAKMVLPILGATTSDVYQRFRKRMHETYKRAPGYPEVES